MTTPVVARFVNVSATIGAVTNQTPASVPGSVSVITPNEQLLLTVTLAVILFCGIVGNALVLVIMLISKEHRKTSTNTFVFNLALADLLFIVFCAPFQGSIYILNEWPYGGFLCKFVHCLQYATMLASILILMFMSVERYAALTQPFRIKRCSMVLVANFISVVIWFFSFVSSLPWTVLYISESYPYQGRMVRVCYDVWPNGTQRKWYIFYFFLLGFAIPVLVISTMSGLTIKAILAHSKYDMSEESNSAQQSKRTIQRLRLQTRKRRKVTIVIFAVAILFLICWLPHNLMIMWINFGHVKFDKTVYVSRFFSHICTYVNSVLNPFLYALLSDNFKRIFRKLFKCATSSSARKLVAAQQKPRPPILNQAQPRCNGNSDPLRNSSNLHSNHSIDLILQQLDPRHATVLQPHYRTTTAMTRLRSDRDGVTTGTTAGKRQADGKFV